MTLNFGKMVKHWLKKQRKWIKQKVTMILPNT